MINDLKNIAELWDRQLVENELGESEYKYAKVKDVYCRIVPSGSNWQKDYNGVDEKVTSNTKFIVRVESIQNLNNSMYFIFKGQRYDFKYSIPNYKEMDRIEIFTQLVVE